MTRARRTVAAALLCVAVFVWPAPTAGAGNPAPPVSLETIPIDVFQPSGGSGYSIRSSCNVGGPCVRLDRGASVTYSFTTAHEMDQIVSHTRGRSSGEVCRYVLSDVDRHGQPATLDQERGCPSTPAALSMTSILTGFFKPSAFAGTYRITISCSGGGISPCNYVELTGLMVETGHAPLWTGLASATTSAAVQWCASPWAAGSLWHPVDYVRITWGDGTETVYTGMSRQDWEQNYGQWYEPMACHLYGPSLVPYQACVSSHDDLGRTARQCYDVEWDPLAA